MSKWDKLIQIIVYLDKNLRFNELRKVLEECGYVMTVPKSGSSHYTFRKPGVDTIITIPRHEPIKRIYVERVRDIILKEGKNNEENR